MVEHTPRYLILDPKEEYTTGEVFYDFDAAVNYFMSHRADPELKIVFRGRGEEESDNVAFNAWLQLIVEAQKQESLPHIAVVIEESSLMSSPHEINPRVRGIYLHGGRHRISLVSITQRDVLVHPIIRDSTHVVVAFRNMMVSNHWARMFDPKKLLTLETLKPGMKAVKNTHFVTYPPDANILEEWVQICRSRPLRST